MTIAKVIELVGESPHSWEEAIKGAIKDASSTIDNINGVEVYNLTANVENGELKNYKANVKLAFGVNR